MVSWESLIVSTVLGAPLLLLLPLLEAAALLPPLLLLEVVRRASPPWSALRSISKIAGRRAAHACACSCAAAAHLLFLKQAAAKKSLRSLRAPAAAARRLYAARSILAVSAILDSL